MKETSLKKSDVFISYGRKESKSFAAKLHNKLKEKGLEVWFDQNDIPLGIDFQEQIDNGIEKAENFIFIIAPHAIMSEFCLKEIVLALKYHKRIIPILHIEPNSKEVWDKLHPAIGKINWVYMREKQDTNKPLYEWEAIDDFEKAFLGLWDLLNFHKEFISTHTELLIKALDWRINKKQDQFLLINNQRTLAVEWLNTKFEKTQPPCLPSDLHSIYICESTKFAFNGWTEVFFSYVREDLETLNKIRESLEREALTTWFDDSDLKTGVKFSAAINKGIEQADNLIFLISPQSIVSEYCLQELDYALKLNKRIIPLLIKETDINSIPEPLRKLQFLNLIEKNIEIKPKELTPFQENMNSLIRQINLDKDYIYLHKKLLSLALKWKKHNENNSILLRGYSLEKAITWLNLGKKRDTNQPIDLHEEFINASIKFSEDASSFDIFVNFSTENTDYLRQLWNEMHAFDKSVWVDKDHLDLQSDENTQNTILLEGIQKSENFLCVITPALLKDEKKMRNIEIAEIQNKRIISLLFEDLEANQVLPENLNKIVIDFNRKRVDFNAACVDLARIMNTDREHVQQHTKWLQKSLDWQKDKDAGKLLRGVDFILASNWIEEANSQNKSPKVTALQTEFINTSRQAIDTEARRKKRVQVLMKIGLVVISVLLVIAVFAGIYALKQTLIARHSLKIAKSNNLIFSSKEMEEKNPTIALGIAIEARKLNENETVENTLLAIYSKHVFYKIAARHELTINSVAFSPNEDRFITGADDNSLAIWDFSGKLIKKQSLHDAAVSCVKYSPSGKLIASASLDGKIILYDKNGNKKSVIQKLKEDITCFDFSPNEQFIVLGTNIGNLAIYNLATDSLFIWEAHQRGVRSVTYTSDGNYIVSGSNDKTAKIWDLKGKVKLVFNKHAESVTSVATSPKSRYILSGSGDNTAMLWDMKGKVYATMKGHENWLNSVRFSAHGTRLITGSDDGTVCIWDTLGNNLNTLRGHSGKVLSVDLSNDNKHIVSVGNDQTARLWNIAETETRMFDTNIASNRYLDVSPDGKYIASGGQDKIVRIWTSNGHLIKELKGHTDKINSVKFSPDNKYLVSASFDKTAIIWSLSDYKKKVITGHKDLVYFASFSPDSKQIVTASRDLTARTWDLNGKRIDVFTGHDEFVRCAVFSPDGKKIATSSLDKTARVWNLSDKSYTVFKGHTDLVTCVTFTPDSKKIITASSDKTLRLWDLEGNEEQIFIGHTLPIYSIVLSKDGTRVLSSSWDKTACLWDIHGNLLQIFFGSEKYLWSAQFCDEEKFVATTGDDGYIRKIKVKKTLLEFENDKNYEPLTINQKLWNHILFYEDLDTLKNPNELLDGVNYYTELANKTRNRAEKLALLNNSLTLIDKICTLSSTVNYYTTYIDVLIEMNKWNTDKTKYDSKINEINKKIIGINNKDELMLAAKYYLKKTTEQNNATKKYEFETKTIAVFEKVIKKYNTNKPLMSKVAEICGWDLPYFLLIEKKYDKARKSCDLAIKADSTVNTAYTNLPLIYLLEGNYAEAEKIYLAKMNLIFNLETKETFGSVFFSDIEDLEARGITCPEFFKAKLLLAEKAEGLRKSNKEEDKKIEE